MNDRLPRALLAAATAAATIWLLGPNGVSQAPTRDAQAPAAAAPAAIEIARIEIPEPPAEPAPAEVPPAEPAPEPVPVVEQPAAESQPPEPSVAALARDAPIAPEPSMTERLPAAEAQEGTPTETPEALPEPAPPAVELAAEPAPAELLEPDPSEPPPAPRNVDAAETRAEEPPTAQVPPRAAPPREMPAPERTREPEPAALAAIARTRRAPPTREGEPTPNRRSTPRLMPLTADAVARGKELLASGTYPSVWARYDRIGFERYRDAMLALGGAFYVFDPDGRRLLARFDARSLEVSPLTSERVPDSLSPWPRDVTAKLPPLPREARAKLGARAKIVLLFPSAVEVALLGGIDRALRRERIDPATVTVVKLAYELADGQLACEVSGVKLRGGAEREVVARIALSRRVPELLRLGQRASRSS